MACCRAWGAATLLLVVATSQPVHARRTQRILWPSRGNGRTEGGSAVEGTDEAIGEAAARRGHRRRRFMPLSAERLHRRRGSVDAVRPSGRRRRELLVAAVLGAHESTYETIPCSSAENSPSSSSDSEPSSETRPETSTESSSESEAEDDLIVICEDHSDCCRGCPTLLRLLNVESHLAYRQPLRDVAKPLLAACGNCNLKETFSMELEPTKLDTLNGGENADGHRWGHGWPQRLDGLQAQALQKTMEISILCSTEAFAKGVVRAVERVICNALVFRVRRDGSRLKEVDPSLSSLRKILSNWNPDHRKEGEEGHVVAKTLLDACMAMSREDLPMSEKRLQRTIRLYDEILVILTKNLETDSNAPIHHSSHQLHSYRGVIYCSSCGTRAGRNQIRRLSKQCEPPTEAGKVFLQRISGGLLPPGYAQWPD